MGDTDKRNGQNGFYDRRLKESSAFEQKYADFFEKLTAMPVDSKATKGSEREAFFREYYRHDEFIMDALGVISPKTVKSMKRRLGTYLGEDISIIGGRTAEGGILTESGSDDEDGFDEDGWGDVLPDEDDCHEMSENDNDDEDDGSGEAYVLWDDDKENRDALTKKFSDDIGKKIDSGIEYVSREYDSKNKTWGEISQVAFLEAVTDSIRKYSGKSGYNFITLLSKICKQKRIEEAERNEELAGRTLFTEKTGYARNRIRRIARLIRNIRGCDGYISEEKWNEIYECVKEQSTIRFSKNDFRDAMVLVEEGIRDIDSLQRTVGGEEDDMTLEDTVGTGIDYVAEIYGADDPVERILDKALKAFNELKELNGLAYRDRYRGLLTMDVLKAMKLDPSIKNAPKQKGVPYNVERRPDIPSGNKELYDAMKKRSLTWFNEVLYPPYILDMVEAGPKTLINMYGVYYNPLKKDYIFTDERLAKSLGITTPTMSRARYNYETIIKPHLFDKFMDALAKD